MLLAAVLAPGPSRAAEPDDGGWRCETTREGANRCFATRPRSELTDRESRKTVLDWWPIDALPEEQRASLPRCCGGLYLQPPLPPEAAGQDPANAPLRAGADRAELFEIDARALLEGNVFVQQGYRRIRADRLDYYRDQDRLELAGNIRIREPGLLFVGERAEINPQSGQSTLYAADYVLHERQARGHADRVERRPDGRIRVDGGSYSSCPPGSEDWSLLARRISLDPETGRGVARDARLRIQDVPILYAPYLSFPIDDRRQTGFLWPQFSRAGNGLDASVPYYVNLAPNYDATLLPRLVAERGLLAAGEFRYQNDWSEWLTSGAYLADDDQARRDRWLFNLQQQGRPLKALTTEIRYTEVSDIDYFRDLSNGGLDVIRQTHLRQGMELNYRVGDWNLESRIQEFQTLDDDIIQPYSMRPRLQLERDFRDRSFELDYSVLAQFTRFDSPRAQRVTGERLYLEPALRFPMYWTPGFVVPTVKYRHIAYELDDPLEDDGSRKVGAVTASLDAGLFLERPANWFGQAFTQTLEPRAYYLYGGRQDHSGLPDFDTADLTFTYSQLFRDTRFGGYDRLTDANQLSLGVTSRLIDGTSGLERLAASIGQIYYFDDREVTVRNRTEDQGTQSKSQIAGELAVRPSPNFWLSNNVVWDPNDTQLDEGGAQLHWYDRGRMLNLGYRYRRQAPQRLAGELIKSDIDQTDVSGVLPVGDRWNLVGRYQYDYTNDQSIEEMLAVEYRSCCWTLSVIWQEGLDRDGLRDEGLFVEFVLFGLGGIGDSIDNILRKSVREFDKTRTQHGRTY